MTEGAPRAWSDVKASFRPPRESVSICARADLVGELDRLIEEHREALRSDELTNQPDRAPALADQIIALREEALASEVTFVFEGIGRARFSELAAEHPATAEQKALASELGFVPEFDGNGFYPALLAASCVEPTGITLAEWQRIYAEWPEGQLAGLRRAALAANTGTSEVPKAERVYARADGTGKNSGSVSG